VAEDMFNQAEMQQVSANVDFQQDVLVAAAMHSMQAATVLAPQVIRQYITRKSLTTKVKQQELAQAEARLKQQLRDQERGEMKSPIDGTILERRESNERQVTAGTLLVSIGNLDTLEVEADILSQDVVNVVVGQPVEIYGPAIGRTPAKGKVTRIYPAGFTKVSSLGVEQQRVKVIVGFEPSEVARLRQEKGLGVGYRVRIRIFTAAKEGVPLVPRSAMFRSPTGDWQVFAVRDSVARLQTIEVGLMNDTVAEAVKGVGADDVVVLSPETTLVDGATVRPVIAKP
jgi:HlyD family secretion protein